MKMAPEAPASPAPERGPEPGPRALPSVPLHGPVDQQADDSMEVLRAAFNGLSVGAGDSEKKEQESEKDAEGMADEGREQRRHPMEELPSESAPGASSHPASPSPTTTTLPASHPAATSTPITTPPTAEGTGFTGMPTPAYGVDPSTTAPPEATTASEPVASSSAPRWYAADYHHHPPLPAMGAYMAEFPGYAAYGPGYPMPAPGYASLSGLRRGPESCGGRSRG